MLRCDVEAVDADGQDKEYDLQFKALGRNGMNGFGQEPLEKVLSEFKRYYGEIEIDLAQTIATEGQTLVNALLGAMPNRLSDGFRQTLYAHTQGHPLFTVELLQIRYNAI